MISKNEFVSKYRAEIALAAILFLSAFLNTWNLWNQGFSNTYYAAAVRSMLANPAVAFYNPFDAAGFITIDKPPVGLWVQAAFAAVLGNSNWVLDLPQALAGVASVALIYFIVARPFGKPAGLIAAFALAVTPIFVATARNETMDLQLIFVILLAVWAALKAARETSFRYLLLAMVLAGIGFNIKMIQAFIVIPGILAVYLLGAAIPFRQKILHLAAALLVLTIVSLSWAVVVDLTPADQRPYIGSSGDNTVFGLISGHNGIERLESTGRSGTGSVPGSFSSAGTMTGGLGGIMASGRNSGGDLGQRSGTGTMTRASGAPGASGQDLAQPGSSGRPDGAGNMTGPSGSGMTADRMLMQAGSGRPPSGPGNMTGQPVGMTVSGQGRVQPDNGGQPGGGGGMGGQGNPHVLRFFDPDLAGQISWLLPFGLIGLVAWLRKPSSISLEGLSDAGITGEKGRTLVAMGLWLLPGLLYFSFTSGFWHTYYLATIAPPLAALVGIGAAGMYASYRKEGAAGWLLVVTVLITGVVEVGILNYDPGFSGLLIPVILAGTVIAAVLLAYLRQSGKQASGNLPVIAMALALAVLFAAPFVWACTPLGYSGGDNLPTAGPQQGSSGGNRMPGGITGLLPGGGITGALTGGVMPADQRQMTGATVNPPSGKGNLTGQRGGMMVSGAGTGQPGTVGQSGRGGMNAPDSTTTETLAAYLLSHKNEETYLAATTGTHSAAGLIIATGEPVMALGGFLGTDQPLTPDEFRDAVRNGVVRYFIASGGGGGMGGGDGTGAIVNWVESSCSVVTDLDGTGSSTSLYDCAGAA